MIARGFVITVDLERGTKRNWVMGADGMKRWVDSGIPCYAHVHQKPVFRVSATYQHTGKIPPRKFPDDGGSVNR